MKNRRRIAALAGRVAGVGRGCCPGRGAIAEMIAVRDPAPLPKPPNCPVCGGCHTLVVREVVVAPGESGVRGDPREGGPPRMADNGRELARKPGGSVP